MLLVLVVQFLYVYLQVVILPGKRKCDWLPSFVGRIKKNKTQPLVDKSRLEQVEQ